MDKDDKTEDLVLDFGRAFWSDPPFRRGKQLDDLRRQNIPHNSRVIDRTDGHDMVSHKTTDLRCPTYKSGSRVYQLGMSFVRDLAAYKGEVRRNRKIKATYHLHWCIEENGRRTLEWFVPDALTAAQEEALAAVVRDALPLGVAVLVFKVAL